ncbi:MAG: hypothetical protein MI725_03485, partial [Pirellulales bacterium]|nr:hypothetical protein [Pirellulales bacterium]
MNPSLSGLRPAVRLATFLAIVAVMANLGMAQGNYLQPTFHPRAEAPQAPPMPGALLAGGPAAAQGDQFMDVQGNPIVMPANYCASCPSGYGGYGPPCPGPYGDPMAVDFGGYGKDQCGPHYFDISAEVVFLKGEDLFDRVSAFGSVTSAASAPLVLDPNNSDNDYEPGWRIAARYDIGALALLEATYMGLYDFSLNNTISSVQGAQLLNPVPTPPNDQFLLQSVFSGFGAPTPIAGLDSANFYALRYEADLQSTEISYRRYWMARNPCLTGSWLIGARYLRMTDTLQFDVQ